MKRLITFIILTVSCSLFGYSLKNQTETFTHQYMLNLKAGKIWIRPIDNSGSWKLLRGIGLPTGKKFESPTEIISINADGNNLVALDRDNHIYLMKFDFMKLNSWKWKEKIGLPFKAQMMIPQDSRAWAVSHRGNVSKHYDDIDGNKFEIKVGISTIYVLQESGTEISYVDPWIPPNFDKKFATPLDGRFIAINLSASSSTVFIINDIGEMYTRLYDFDTAGGNPFFNYTYKPQKKSDSLSGSILRARRLPAERWRKQPQIDGLITKHITIVQNGTGNAGRELRVEGINDDGKSGHFYKQIFDDKWKFKIDHHHIERLFLENGAQAILAGKITKDYSGKMMRDRAQMEVQLLNFHPNTPLGIFQFTVNETVFQARFYVRSFSYKKDGRIKAIATIVLPDSFVENSSNKIFRIKRNFFGNRTKYFNLNMTISEKKISMRTLLPSPREKDQFGRKDLIIQLKP